MSSKSSMSSWNEAKASASGGLRSPGVRNIWDTDAWMRLADRGGHTQHTCIEALLVDLTDRCDDAPCKYCATSAGVRLDHTPSLPVLSWNRSADLPRKRLPASPSSILRGFAASAIDIASMSLRHQQTSAKASPPILIKPVPQDMFDETESMPLLRLRAKKC